VVAAPLPGSARASETTTAGSGWRVAVFSADVTIPIGHTTLVGGTAPAREIVDPLLARGLVLLGGDRPVVIAAVDWCEIRHGAYDRWRSVLADAAGTTPERVMLTSVHQHDAPVADLVAQRLLDRVGLEKSLMDADFHEQAVQRTAAALKAGLGSARPVTHYGVGRARVEQIASNRRVVDPEGKARYARNSATGQRADLREAPEGLIDPYLRTLSFWDADRPVAAVSVYATHPMSFYGQGGVSADFVGLARARRQKDDPSVFQVYMSGCSGDVTAGKYNSGAKENRPVLANRLYQAMLTAWKDTTRHPLARAEYRVAPLRLEPRYLVAELEARIGNPALSRPERNLAALGLSWHERVASGRPIDVPVLDLGAALFMLLPAESFVEYQLIAQRARPDAFVIVAGYSECAPGYIPTDVAFEEGFDDVWLWTRPGAQARMTEAIRKALQAR